MIVICLAFFLPLILYLRSLISESIVCKAINNSAGLKGEEFEDE